MEVRDTTNRAGNRIKVKNSGAFKIEAEIIALAHRIELVIWIRFIWLFICALRVS